MDASRPQAYLGYLKAPSFAEQYVFFRNSHILEAYVHVAAGRVVLPEDLHTFKNLDPGCVLRNQYLGLLFVGGGIRTGFNHGDHDLTARVASAGDIILFSVYHPLVTIEYRLGADIFCV